jgi:hypothetical protein
VGLRAGLDVAVKRKISSPCWDLNPPIIYPIAQCYTKLEGKCGFCVAAVLFYI